MSIIAGSQVARRVRQVPRDPANVLYEWFHNQHWTSESYLALANSENAFVELSDGKAVIYEMPTPAHQSIVGNLYMALRVYARTVNQGRAFVAPLPVQLWRSKFREPDVLFYKTAHQERIKEQFVESPDWVAEVISPSTRSVDMLTKVDEYALAGIAEYWLIDPERRYVTVYVLPEGAESYEICAEYTAGQVLTAVTLPAFRLAIEELFQA